MNPHHQRDNPAEDHQAHQQTKIPKQITPWHHDPMEINFSVADAPSALILPAAGAAGTRPGGARC